MIAFVICQCPNCKTVSPVDCSLGVPVETKCNCGELFNTWDNARERNDDE